MMRKVRELKQKHAMTINLAFGKISVCSFLRFGAHDHSNKTWEEGSHQRLFPHLAQSSYWPRHLSGF